MYISQLTEIIHPAAASCAQGDGWPDCKNPLNNMARGGFLR